MLPHFIPPRSPPRQGASRGIDKHPGQGAHPRVLATACRMSRAGVRSNRNPTRFDGLHPRVKAGSVTPNEPGGGGAGPSGPGSGGGRWLRRRRRIRRRAVAQAALCRRGRVPRIVSAAQHCRVQLLFSQDGLVVGRRGCHPGNLCLTVAPRCGRRYRLTEAGIRPARTADHGPQRVQQRESVPEPASSAGRSGTYRDRRFGSGYSSRAGYARPERATEGEGR